VNNYKLRNKHEKRWPKVVLFTFVLLALSLVAGVFGIRTLYEQNLRAVDLTATQRIVFTVESGDNVAIIAEGLKGKQLIRSKQAFVQYVRTNNLAESFKAGTYSLQQSFDVPTIVGYLVEGKVDKNLFTIFPGQNLEQIKQAMIKIGGFNESDVATAFDPAIYQGHPALVDKPVGASLEGYLYPDSYERIKETMPETIIRQSLDEMAEALSPDVRAGIARQGLNVFEGITLASIIEREVGAVDINGQPNDNRQKAAQVFLKRLSIGMMLQSNATDDSPPNYDTYSIAGLPPGPISNVTTSSLQAVSAPANTDFLYFVSGKDCLTRFSGSESEHELLKQQHGVARPEDNCRG
jgi:UPF0755 protein